MKLRYNVPEFTNIVDSISDRVVTDYIACYMQGLQDAGAIEAYDIESFKGRRFWSFGYSILTIELVDETRREQIDATLRKYSAKSETVPQTA